MSVFVCVHIYIYIYICVYVCVCVCLCAYVCVFVCLCERACASIYLCVYPAFQLRIFRSGENKISFWNYRALCYLFWYWLIDDMSKILTYQPAQSKRLFPRVQRLWCLHLFILKACNITFRIIVSVAIYISVIYLNLRVTVIKTRACSAEEVSDGMLWWRLLTFPVVWRVCVCVDERCRMVYLSALLTRPGGARQAAASAYRYACLMPAGGSKALNITIVARDALLRFVVTGEIQQSCRCIRTHIDIKYFLLTCFCVRK